jgi:hypothetical protein
MKPSVRTGVMSIVAKVLIVLVALEPIYLRAR